MEEKKPEPGNEVKELTPPMRIPDSPKISRVKMVILGICGIVVIISFAGAYFLGKSSNNESLSPTPSEKACTQEAMICPDGSSVGRSGPNCEFEKCPNVTPTPKVNSSLDKTYTSSEHKFQVDYSSDLKMETYNTPQIGQNTLGGTVVFSKLGPTQKEGTEFYDGLSITIGVVKKSISDSLKTAADKETTPSDPEISTKTPLKEIEINSLSGYETTVNGLGSFKITILEYPGKTDRMYYIATFAEGPGESKVEYQAVVSSILESFRNVE